MVNKYDVNLSVFLSITNFLTGTMKKVHEVNQKEKKTYSYNKIQRDQK